MDWCAHCAPSLPVARAVGSRQHGATLVQCNAHSADDLTRLLDEVQPHVVIHLAAAGVSPRDREATNLIKSNVDFTVNLMLAAERSVRPIVVHAGSWP